MTKFITFILIITSQISFAQQTNLRQALNTIVTPMADDNMYKSASIGYGAAKTKQWKRFVELKKIATDEELILLTDNDSPAVRCYAFQALIERENPATFDILLKHLTDNETIQSFQGMIVKKQQTGDFFLDLYGVQPDEQVKVDSILFFNPDVKLAAKSDLLQRIKPKEEYYTRLQEIAIKEKNPSALMALAKFQKKKDVSLIISWLEGSPSDQYHGLRAVRYFANTAFFPYLKKIQQAQVKEQLIPNHNLIRALYFAVVQYKTPQGRQLIENSLHHTKGSTHKLHAKYIWLALSKYPSATYAGLKKEIKLSDFEKNTLKHWLEGED